MTPIQTFFTKLFPSKAAEMQAESERWMVRCPNCGFERSVWELGGIRWKAKGNPKQRRPCPQCNQTTWHTLYQKSKP